MTLLDLGWDAINLGPHTPFQSFREAALEHRPALMWVSVSHLVNPEDFVRGYEEFYRFAERESIPVALGGRCIDEALRARMSYTTTGVGLTHLASMARALHNPPRPPRRGRPPGSMSE
jgi:methanogenic corrinoid protein MtbC1